MGCSDLVRRKHAPWTAVHEVKLRVMALQATTAEVAPQAAALRALPQALQAAAEVLQAEALQAALQSVEEALWAVELPLRVMATGRRTRMSQG